MVTFKQMRDDVDKLVIELEKDSLAVDTID